MSGLSDRVLAQRQLRDLQATLGGVEAADSMAFLLGYLLASGGLSTEAWDRAMAAHGAHHPDRQMRLDRARAEESVGRHLWPVPDLVALRCVACHVTGHHAAGCPLA